jgi:hypothetical protein
VSPNAQAESLRPPGVYFDRVERAAPQARRRSDIAGFVGVVVRSTPKPETQKDLELEKAAVRCDGLQDFYGNFRKPLPSGYFGAAVRGFFANGGRTCFVAPIFVDLGLEKEDDAAASKIELTIGDFTSGLDQLASADAVSMIAVPDLALLEAGQEDVRRAMVAQAELLRDRIALLDPSQDWIAQPNWTEIFPQSDSALAALYWPWLQIGRDPSDAALRHAPIRTVPPCGHIAGTIARRDLERGVFAPPANLRIEGAVGVTAELAPEKRAAVNDAGINVIVATPGRGVRAMGARTLSEESHPFRWLNVRRLITHLAEWIEQDTQWMVFEPQDPVLWRAIERLVRTILFDLWRRGGLVGKTDDEAYFVHCNAATNPRAESELGRVICVVGLRPPPPAEMIVVRIGVAEGRVELLDREVPDA